MRALVVTGCLQNAIVRAQRLAGDRFLLGVREYKAPPACSAARKTRRKAARRRRHVLTTPPYSISAHCGRLRTAALLRDSRSSARPRQRTDRGLVD
jgi:hypothetical protein